MHRNVKQALGQLSWCQPCCTPQTTALPIPARSLTSGSPGLWGKKIMVFCQRGNEGREKRREEKGLRWGHRLVAELAFADWLWLRSHHITLLSSRWVGGSRDPVESSRGGKHRPRDAVPSPPAPRYPALLHAPVPQASPIAETDATRPATPAPCSASSTPVLLICRKGNKSLSTKNWPLGTAGAEF